MAVHAVGAWRKLNKFGRGHRPEGTSGGDSPLCLHVLLHDVRRPWLACSCDSVRAIYTVLGDASNMALQTPTGGGAVNRRRRMHERPRGVHRVQAVAEGRPPRTAAGEPPRRQWEEWSDADTGAPATANLARVVQPLHLDQLCVPGCVVSGGGEKWSSAVSWR